MTDWIGVDMDHRISTPRTHKDIQAENQYCLYRLYDQEHDLLYVGATHNFRNRMQTHRHEQVWWLDVYEPYTITEWFDTVREVADAEDRAIRRERPIWNRAGRTSAMIPYSYSPPIEPDETDIRSISEKLAARKPDPVADTDIEELEARLAARAPADPPEHGSIAERLAARRQ